MESKTPEAVNELPPVPVFGVDSDEELYRQELLTKITHGLFQDEFLTRMVREKGGPLEIPQIQALLVSGGADEVERKEQKQFAEDSRFDYLLRMKNALNDKFENSPLVHPHGMTDHNYKSVPEARRPGLERFKMKIRRENYVYMGTHPDIDAMVSLCLQKAIKAKPAEPVKFAADFFTYRGSNHADFMKAIDEEKKRLHRYRNESIGVRKEPPGASHPPAQLRRNSWRHYEPNKFDGVNQTKKLGLGALACDFGVTPPPSLAHTARSERKTVAPPPAVAPEPAPEPVKKFYCGCKDPGRRDHRRKTKVILPEETHEVEIELEVEGEI